MTWVSMPPSLSLKAGSTPAPALQSYPRPLFHSQGSNKPMNLLRPHPLSEPFLFYQSAGNIHLPVWIQVLWEVFPEPLCWFQKHLQPIFIQPFLTIHFLGLFCLPTNEVLRAGQPAPSMFVYPVPGTFTIKLPKLKLQGPCFTRPLARPQEGPKTYIYF